MERRLKVLMCAYAVDDKDVGEASLSFDWISQITRFADVTLVTMGSRIHSKCGFEEHPNVTLAIVKPELTFRWTGAFDRVMKPDYVEFYCRARQRAKKLVGANDFDVCHHIAPHSPRYPSPLHNLGLPLLIGPIHGGLHLPPSLRKPSLKTYASQYFNQLDRLRYRYDPVMKDHFKGASKILISAPYVRNILPEEYQAKCEVLPPQPAKTLDVKGLTQEKKSPFRFIFVGRLIPSKGIDMAVEAFAQLGDNCDAHFDVYGTGELKNSLQNRIIALGLQDKVTLHGFVQHDEVLKRFSMADVFIFPSLKEAWGLAVVEAMAAGLPVICVNRGGPGYIVDETCGIKIECKDRAGLILNLSEGMQYMLENRDEVRQMGERARVKVDTKFTWDAVMGHLKALYQELSVKTKKK